MNDRKMKELILYLASRSEEDPRFSATKLNKLPFYCDFTAYRLRRGAYRPNGPGELAQG